MANDVMTTTWMGDAATGVVSRRDTLTNSGARPVVVSRCLARVTLPPGRYECYTQASVGSRESQGAWNPLHTGLRLQESGVWQEQAAVCVIRPARA